MTDTLEWFRANVCRPARHDHDGDEELDCLLQARLRLRQGEPLDRVVPGLR